MVILCLQLNQGVRQPTHTVKLHCVTLLIVAFVQACTVDTPQTNAAASSSSTRTVVAGWESTTVRHDSTSTGTKARAPVFDSGYNASLVSSVLPDEQARVRVTLAANDETDMTNYQSSGWSLGWDNDVSDTKPPRFSADFVRFTSGVLILKLDTGLVRNRPEAPFDTKLADSIAVRGLGITERFATDCKFGIHVPDERLTGLVPDTTPERWMRPRLAWLFDTASARIRRIKPDSISCALSSNPD